MVLEILRKKVQENPKWIESPNYRLAQGKHPDFRAWVSMNNFNDEEIYKAFETLRLEYLNRNMTYNPETPTEIPTVTVREEPIDVTQGQAKEMYDYLKAAKLDGRFRNTYMVAKIHNPTSLVEWRYNNHYPDKLVERIFYMVDEELGINK